MMSDHNHAAFLAYAIGCDWLMSSAGKVIMRMFIGLILGCALTIGGLYAADKATAGPEARPMVNWDVVSKNFDDVVALAKDGLKKITG